MTFEESPEDIRRNVLGFGWDVAKFEREGSWAFVDASAKPGERLIFSGDFDLEALIARIKHAIEKTGAKRVALDSVAAIFSQFSDHAAIRGELFQLVSALKGLGMTALLTAERTREYGPIARHGVEEFVADNVVILRNILDSTQRRRTLEILKFRGTPHHKGEYTFSVLPDRGIVVIPISAISLTQESSNVRISSGVEALDAMCGGGFFRDSIVLLSGATGTGKTLTATHFTASVEDGERAMYFGFEESRSQLIRNAENWGVDFEAMEQKGRLEILCNYPETRGLEDHLIYMKQQIERFKPRRVSIDSLSALERVASEQSFREFVIALTAFFKQHQIAALVTNTAKNLLGGTSVTEAHISTLTDSIILLRYFELFGEMHRGLTVLKMRGSMHDKDIRSYHIDDQGMHIGKPFRNVSGILSGSATHNGQSETDRLGGLFRE